MASLDSEVILMGSQLDPPERLEAASTHHASSHPPKQSFGSALSYIYLYKIHLYYIYIFQMKILIYSMEHCHPQKQFSK